ncbi:MAG TPA: hypothetical protein VK920_03845 [Solirubrobacterales bacterium]|nr:hypothetical protein [Solirubrobacterales bacterium]
MDPDVRTAIIAVGMVFCLLLGGLTLGVIAESGLDILSLASLLIVGLLLIGLIGAMRNPPE